MQSATQHPEIIDDYLLNELLLNRILGPFSPHLAPSIHINCFGCIPKKHQVEKWHLITDLSFPEDESVNDAIDPKLCSVKYITVDQVARHAVLLRRGSLIAKIDIKSAYRLILGATLLGMFWRNHVYIDGMLPFGLRLTHKIFTAVADALEWCISRAGVEYIYHYLDDFVVLGCPDAEQCVKNLSTLKTVCGDLGVLLAPEKQADPSTRLEFLGIIIDTLCQELQLPDDKLSKLKDFILVKCSHWQNKEM